MLRSMYSGISGLKGFQTKLDVVGNNIANVNTSGFKKGRITFQDMMSQTTRGAQAAVAGGRGGINPIQVGLGSKVGSIDNIHTQGFTQTTGSSLDVAIEGNGMFVVTDGESIYYTRAGNFYFDDNGDIVNSDGLYLVGMDGILNDGSVNLNDPNESYKINLPNDFQSFSIAENGDVNYVDAAGDPQTAGTIGLANFSNPTGLEKIGSNLFLDSANAGFTGIGAPETEGLGKTVAGALEMSNVDLSEEFTEMIVAQRGFQANTRIITTSDEILQELVNLKR